MGGIYENNNSFDKECWLESEPWQLWTISTVLLSLIFHHIILSMLCCKYYNSLHMVQYKAIINRLSRFVLVYTFIRVLPTMERIWECFSTGPPPFWLIVGHHGCVASIGICNFIAWHINKMDRET